jgi:hypothetical protein
MVMGKDDSCGIQLKSLLKHLPRINRRLVDRSFAHANAIQNMIPVIQKHD